MRRIVWAIAIGALLVSGAWAFAIEGTPFAWQSISVTGAIATIPNTLCRVGGVATGFETPALIQVQTNGIYYRLDSGTATAVATNYVGSVGDIYEVKWPSKFNAVKSGAGNANLAVTCFLP